jgi:hypothetical protein
VGPGRSGTFREHPTPAQWLCWCAAAVIAGGWLGIITYAVGPVGLITGPVGLLVVVPVMAQKAIQRTPFGRPFMRRRIAWFTIMLAISCTASGATIFL